MKARTAATAAIGALAVLALAAVGRLAIRLDELNDRHVMVVEGLDELAGDLGPRVEALELLARQ